MRNLRYLSASVFGLIAVQACRAQSRQPELSPVYVGDAVAYFAIAGESGPAAPGRDTRGYLHCAIRARFTGVAYTRGDQVEVIVDSGAIAVTRNQDKEWGDDLHVRFMLGRGHPAGGTMPQAEIATVEVRLTPTVDTSAVPITTWQAQDTMHLLLPWDGRGPDRRIFAHVSYRARDLDGKASECEAFIPGDTLRFAQ